jgi:imidazolonepropionase-like amidohydrolase
MLRSSNSQSNWGDNFRTRYPQTRMGVEALIRAQFTQAKTYGAALKADPTTRRDLRLEALWEVLQGKRMVHVHSYRADEILMFARLSQEFGFKIGAYQHVLEGYKVAKEINEVGAGASTFADWWAFKLEVIDAIPNNAAIMQRQGVLVSLNSDSPDLGRRLNTEAAKAVRYGNLSATEALKLVTLNPAKQLRIDAEVGSIEVGKSADLVLWNHAPLSTMARPERVWIDGRLYFERSADQVEQARVNTVRAELIQAALKERVKALADKSDAPPSKLATLPWRSRQHWPSAWIANRGLYHNGEATHFCTDGE